MCVDMYNTICVNFYGCTVAPVCFCTPARVRLHSDVHLEFHRCLGTRQNGPDDVGLRGVRAEERHVLLHTRPEAHIVGAGAKGVQQEPFHEGHAGDRQEVDEGVLLRELRQRKALSHVLEGPQYLLPNTSHNGKSEATTTRQRQRHGEHPNEMLCET